MDSGQKILILTILKIFNWRKDKSLNKFETSALISRKTITCNFTEEDAVFNYSLRISFTSDENEIVLKIIHLANDHNLLGEFNINLEHLAKKKIQLLQFGKSHTGLKLIAEPSKSDKHQNNTHQSNKNNNKNTHSFIRQKEEFLKKIANNNERLNNSKQTRSTKSFSEKAQQLLSEVQAFKGEKKQQNPIMDIQQEFNDYYYNNQHNEQLIQHKKIGKQTLLTKVAKSGSLRDYSYVKKREQICDTESDRLSNSSQKHKLKLKNLEMVPCQNQYYDAPMNQHKSQRKSDILSREHPYNNRFNHSSKKVFRSQFC